MKNNYTMMSLLQEIFPMNGLDTTNTNNTYSTNISYKWMYFDDENVEEVPTSSINNIISPPNTGASVTSIMSTTTAMDKIVSDKAYVLFYKRRVLTTSNIITVLGL